MATRKETAGAPAGETIEGEGGAVRVEGRDAAAVALGEAVATAGPPAAGQGRVAEIVDGPAVQEGRIVDGADALRPRAPAEDPAFVSRLPAGTAVVRRSGRDSILPLSAPTVDPDTVPGRKVAIATTQVRRDGMTYLPGEAFAIDFRSHAELVPIGAIAATPWHDLPDW